jgi:hypothetical protein
MSIGSTTCRDTPDCTHTAGQIHRVTVISLAPPRLSPSHPAAPHAGIGPAFSPAPPPSSLDLWPSGLDLVSKESRGSFFRSIGEQRRQEPLVQQHHPVATDHAPTAGCQGGLGRAAPSTVGSEDRGECLDALLSSSHPRWIGAAAVVNKQFGDDEPVQWRDHTVPFLFRLCDGCYQISHARCLVGSFISWLEKANILENQN